MYNEEVFASLDWVIDQAAQRNLKLIIPIEVRLGPTRALRCFSCCP